jgi:hypothetical protein
LGRTIERMMSSCCPRLRWPAGSSTRGRTAFTAQAGSHLSHADSARTARTALNGSIVVYADTPTGPRTTIHVLNA